MAKKIICKNCKFKKDDICAKKTIIKINKKVETVINIKADKTECQDYVQLNNEL